MSERFIEDKIIDPEVSPIKKLARSMLDKFRARFRRSEKLESSDDSSPISSTEEADLTDSETTDPGTDFAPDSSGERAATMPDEVKIKDDTDDDKKNKKRPERTEKVEYDSVVTANYFEDWDELELDGNPEIKDSIRANIIRAEKLNEQAYRNAAADLGITVEEFKARLQAKVDTMVRQADFFRATHVDVIDSIMNTDGRWKSQFETSTSNGNLNPNYRAAQEIRMFGFNQEGAPEIGDRVEEYAGYYGDKKLPAKITAQNRELRPIYGYFSDNEHGGINDYGTIPPPTNVTQYGKVNFKIKKERALRKATLTFHDSLGPGNDWPPTPASKPHFTSFRLNYNGSRILGTKNGPSITNWGESYTEVQYHGQLKMDDIESIHMSSQNGLHKGDIELVRIAFKAYKKQHPESSIKLIEF